MKIEIPKNTKIDVLGIPSWGSKLHIYASFAASLLLIIYFKFCAYLNQ